MLSSELYFAAIGGALIAISTSFHLLFKGRITGMSGIYFGVITADNKSAYWKIFFILMAFLTAIVAWEIVGFDKLAEDYPNLFDHPQFLISNLNKPGYFLAGLFVGLGTKLGNGCTSGHGVCGLPRFSIRSWVYVPIFLVVAIVTATLRYYVPFLDSDDMNFETIDYSVIINAAFVLTGWGVLFYCLYYYSKFTWALLTDILVTACTGIVFAIGLIVPECAKEAKFWDSSP